MSIRQRVPPVGAASPPRTLRMASAATGGFFQTADFNEWEGLDQRLTKLEGQITGTLGGYSSFQQEFKGMSASFAALVSRVGELERQIQQQAASINDVKRQQESFATAELGRETRYQNLERVITRMDDRMRAHSQNAALHSHDDEPRSSSGVRGFRANDQPREFMGSGR